MSLVFVFNSGGGLKQTVRMALTGFLRCTAGLLLLVACWCSDISLVVVGHFPDSSGFGEEARDIVFGLHKLGVTMKLVRLFSEPLFSQSILQHQKRKQEHSSS